jgi:outer membrane protein assembly factor BamB
LACLLVVACSNKEKLDGSREEIILPDDDAEFESNPTSDLLMENAEFANREVPQPFMNATHCYSPLKFSTNPIERWTSTLDFCGNDSIRMTASPLLAEGKVFCLDGAGIVYAIDSGSGKRIWRTSTLVKGKDGQIGGAVAYYGGKLIVTSSFAECFLLDAGSGKILWRIKLPAPCKGDGITVSEGKAFIMCSNNSLQVIQIDNGKTIWSHSGTMQNSSFLGSASVAIDDGMVFLAYSSGEIFALSADTGSVIWDSAFSKFSLTNSAHSFTHPRACPVVAGDLVYFCASNEQTVAFDKKNGNRRWACNIGGLQTPSVSGSSIFVLCPKSTLACLNRYTGKLRWRCQLESDVDMFSDWYGQLLVGGHILMISPRGKFLFVSPDGKIKRTINVTDKKDSLSVNPIIVDGVLYLLLNNGTLGAFH